MSKKTGQEDFLGLLLFLVMFLISLFFQGAQVTFRQSLCSGFQDSPHDLA
ncbi:MAG TPA: hypothetical protein VFQ13_16900 [Anaerolineales bacterium]|nr:hypothetical protein [Anaerolineales bacterium]